MALTMGVWLSVTDQGVRIVDTVFLVQLREILEIHLVNDADPRGYDAERVEGLHRPTS